MQDTLHFNVMESSTLTIRLPKEQRQALKRAASALNKSESNYIRDLLQRDLDMRSFGERAGHLAGCVDSSKSAGTPHPLKERIRERNWRG